MASSRILVVDDDRAVRSALRLNLGRNGYDVTLAADGTAALAAMETADFDLVLTDVKMPGMSGHDLLAHVQARSPDLPVVMMTGHGDVEDAVDAMRAGAADYVIKPVSRDELLLVLQRAQRSHALEVENAQLRAELAGRPGFEGVIGQTPAMQTVFTLIDAVASSDALVLLTGPTGTGKELLARALHTRSHRAQQPFVAVNCAALPEGLLESELFGHEKGAFTGAIRQHLGKFEQADGGTLFLDEIGEIPHATQVRLLRVLESAELQRVGGRQTLSVNVRVVAATNRDLRNEVLEGRFREDLYYRLNVFHIPVPPLRDRKDDIPLLAEHFLAKFATRHRRTTRQISAASLRALSHHDWPGNVRELEHVIERATILCSGPVLEDVHLPNSPAIADPKPAGPPPAALPLSGTLPEALEALERSLVVAALRAEKGVQARAARRLGVSRSNLNYRIQKLGIRVREVLYE